MFVQAIFSVQWDICIVEEKKIVIGVCLWVCVFSSAPRLLSRCADSARLQVITSALSLTDTISINIQAVGPYQRQLLIILRRNSLILCYSSRRTDGEIRLRFCALKGRNNISDGLILQPHNCLSLLTSSLCLFAWIVASFPSFHLLK